MGEIGLFLSDLENCLLTKKELSVRIYAMKTNKWERRDTKRNKRNRMQVSGKSVFVIQRVLIKKGSK